MAFEPVFPAPAKPFRQLHGSSLHLQVFPLRAVCASAGMLDISRGPVLTLGHLPPFRSDQLGFSTMQINTPMCWQADKSHPKICQEMGVSENSGTRKSSILIGFSIINHPFWGTTILGNTQIEMDEINSANRLENLRKSGR